MSTKERGSKGVDCAIINFNGASEGGVEQGGIFCAVNDPKGKEYRVFKPYLTAGNIFPKVFFVKNKISLFKSETLHKNPEGLGVLEKDTVKLYSKFLERPTFATIRALHPKDYIWRLDNLAETKSFSEIWTPVDLTALPTHHFNRYERFEKPSLLKKKSRTENQ